MLVQDTCTCVYVLVQDTCTCVYVYIPACCVMKGFFLLLKTHAHNMFV